MRWFIRSPCLRPVRLDFSRKSPKQRFDCLIDCLIDALRSLKLDGIRDGVNAESIYHLPHTAICIAILAVVFCTGLISLKDIWGRRLTKRMSPDIWILLHLWLYLTCARLCNCCMEFNSSQESSLCLLKLCIARQSSSVPPWWSLPVLCSRYNKGYWFSLRHLSPKLKLWR